MTEKDTPEFSVSNVGGVRSVRSFKIWRLLNSSCDVFSGVWDTGRVGRGSPGASP